VDVDAGVAVGLALEAQPQVEITKGLLGGEVAELLGDAFTVDGAVFDDPFFMADLGPAGKILAVE